MSTTESGSSSSSEDSAVELRKALSKSKIADSPSLRKRPSKDAVTFEASEGEKEAPPRMSKQISSELKRKAREAGLTPIQLHFSNLTYQVQTKKRGQMQEWKTVLQDINGYFDPGTLTGIMGTSGAGKTTLLNVLAGRVGHSGVTEGQILYNGHPKSEAKQLLKHQAYVMQDDILMPSQTGRECLTFSAKLRIPNTVKKEDKIARVDKIIDELNLGGCQNTPVGAPGGRRGVSGGERKRISIGVELVTNPSLLFLDEPTSGLDSETAELVMENLKQLAASGRTIVATIHQPNSLIFAKLDNLILLAKGRMVYFGPAIRATEYFANLGHPTPPLTNPADWFMKLCYIDQSQKNGSKRVDKLIKAFSKSEELEKLQDPSAIHEVPIKAEKVIHHGYAQSTITQALLVFRRHLTDLARAPMKLRVGLAQTFFLAFLLGLIYLRLDNDQSGVQSKLGALFFVITNQAMLSVQSVVINFPADKTLFLREHSNNMYRTTAYFIAKLAAEFPFQVLFPTFFSIIVYGMVGLQAQPDQVFIFILIVLTTAQVGSAMGLTVGVIAKDANVAVALVPVTIIPFMIFSGFLVNTDNVPTYFVWIERISLFKYGFTAVVMNEFTSDLHITCTAAERIPGCIGDACCKFNNGMDVVRSFGFEGDSIRYNFTMLLVLLLSFRVISYVALLLRARNNANS